MSHGEEAQYPNRLKSQRFGRLANNIPSLEHTGGPKRTFQPSYVPEFTDPEKFIEDRLKIFREHLYINPTEEEVRHLKTFKTEGEINAALKTIINNHWE